MIGQEMGENSMELYDLIVIGGGPGGYRAAEVAAHRGQKTLLFEKRALGGVCLNEGCVPSKTLLNSAKYYDHAQHGIAFGVTCTDPKLDQKAVITRKSRVVRTLVSGIRAKMRATGVTVVMDAAQITGKNEQGFTVRCGQEEYVGKRLIIAAGSSAIVPPIPGVAENLGQMVLTNREILDLEQIPEKLVVIGGGVIGLEMAAYYATVGSKVTVIEMQDHIAGMIDRQITASLQRQMERKGVTFLLSHKCLSVEPGIVRAEAPDGQVLSVEADKVLLSIGRRANTEGLGLETIGLQFDRRGIPIDEKCRTNVPDVYAVGDVTGQYMLAHTAYREAEVAVNHILGKNDSMRYIANPAVIYTYPEIGVVGKTEEDCQAAGIPYEVRSLPMSYSGRFVAENDGTEGLCKVIVHKKNRTVLGVHMIGAYSGEIIWGAAEMVEMYLQVKHARQIIFPHPTVSEIIREVLWEFDD